jgi:hypothetical protein
MESFFALLQNNVLDRQRWATRDDLRIALINLDRTDQPPPTTPTPIRPFDPSRMRNDHGPNRSQSCITNLSPKRAADRFTPWLGLLDGGATPRYGSRPFRVSESTCFCDSVCRVDIVPSNLDRPEGAL